jgi:RNA polymerase sigma factor (sigma-70 family)
VAVQRSDAELARDARGGSEAAYRELVARYAAPAVNFAYRLVHDRAVAEDLAQEGFLRVYQRLDTFDPERKFSSWFFQVLRNVTIDYLRVHRLPTASLDGLQEAGRSVQVADRVSASPEEPPRFLSSVPNTEKSSSFDIRKDLPSRKLLRRSDFRPAP